MKIAVVRGPSLNKFEMQYFEPLSNWHDVVCFGSTRPVYETKNINLTIIKLPCWGQILGSIPGATRVLYQLLGDPQRLWGLQSRVKGFDIIHTAELFSYYTHQALLVKKKGQAKKVVATVSENIPFNQEWYPRQKALKDFAKENLDYILAISNLSKEAMVLEGYPEEKITVVPHGLDLGLFKPGAKDEVLAKRLGIQKNDTVILSVGRLIWEKGFHNLLLAAKRLKDDTDLLGKNLKFLIIGNGPEKANLSALADRLGLKKEVIFGQGLPYEQMSRVYNLADIFVLSSIPTKTWQEQFGMVLIEAMACGLPVVATRTGGIPEVVGDCASLISPNCWPELARAINKLVINSQDRKSFSQKGQERVRKLYDRTLVAKKIEEVYFKIYSQ